jgi:hypothetical protein
MYDVLYCISKEGMCKLPVIFDAHNTLVSFGHLMSNKCTDKITGIDLPAIGTALPAMETALPAIGTFPPVRETALSAIHLKATEIALPATRIFFRQLQKQFCQLKEQLYHYRNYSACHMNSSDSY